MFGWFAKRKAKKAAVEESRRQALRHGHQLADPYPYRNPMLDSVFIASGGAPMRPTDDIPPCTDADYGSHSSNDCESSSDSGGSDCGGSDSGGGDL